MNEFEKKGRAAKLNHVCRFLLRPVAFGAIICLQRRVSRHVASFTISRILAISVKAKKCMLYVHDPHALL